MVLCVFRDRKEVFYFLNVEGVSSVDETNVRMTEEEIEITGWHSLPTQRALYILGYTSKTREQIRRPVGLQTVECAPSAFPISAAVLLQWQQQNALSLCFNGSGEWMSLGIRTSLIYWSGLRRGIMAVH